MIADFKDLDGNLKFLRKELSKAINEAVERSCKRLENRLTEKPLRNTWQSYSPPRKVSTHMSEEGDKHIVNLNVNMSEKSKS